MSFVKRIEHLRPEGAYVVLARAQELEAQGRDIIHLEIGQPDFDTYANVSLAGIRAIAEGKTGYNPSAGITPLRQALAEDAGRRRDVTFAMENVVVGPGAKPFLFMPLLALLESGDQVIYPDPGFPTYEAAIAVAGGVPVPIPLDAERGFDLDLDAFDAHVGPKTKLAILNSPGNPTGGIYSLETLQHVAEMAQRHDFWVLSDEVYSRLVYGEQAPSITILPGMMERTILLDGFSKTYAMTGWRLGYGIMPEALAQKVSLLLNHSIGCTATFTQYAGLEAILGPQDQVEVVRAEFQRRRDVIVEGLNAIPGIRCHMPRGAFYVFPNVEAYGRPVRELARYMLDEAGVALLPGTDFGANGAGHLRLSYASSIENIQEALDRMRDALEALT
jgi:aspartate aminotransferase